MEIGYAALSTSVSVDKIIFVVIVCNLLLNGVTSYITCNFYRYPFFHIKEALPGGGVPCRPSKFENVLCRCL